MQVNTQPNTELTTKEKARIMKNAYQRDWAKRNPDKIRAYKEKHYAKQYDKMIDQIIDDFVAGHERGEVNG